MVYFGFGILNALNHPSVQAIQVKGRILLADVSELLGYSVSRLLGSQPPTDVLRQLKTVRIHRIPGLGTETF